MKFSHKMEGLADIKKALRELPAEIQDRPIKGALRAAGKELKTAVEAAAPYDGKTPDGVHIRDNIFVGRSRRQSGPGREVFVVGVKYGKSEYKDTGLNRRLGRVGKKFKTEGAAWYWKLLEFGTSRIAKQSFIRPTFESSRSNMEQAFVRRMKQSVERLAKKYDKGVKK